MRKGLTAIVKVTSGCNLRCSYCYELKSRNNMDYLTLENTIEKISEFNGPEKITEFIYHGGEPLLRGIPFFEKIVEIQRNFNERIRFSNKVQTNATLLNNDFADFFKENKFKVGVSLDGYGIINDRTRRFSDNRGSFEEVKNGIRIAKSRDVLGGIICVVNRENIAHLSELYHFAMEERINIKFNPVFRSINSRDYFSELSISSEEYVQSMVELFDEWWSEKINTIVVEPFEQIIEGLLTGKPVGCNFRSDCQERFISIFPNGEAYPCERFSGFSQFCLGNINNSSVMELQESTIRKMMRNRRVEECQKCEYNAICNSGCPLVSYLDSGSINTKPEFCHADFALFDHIKKKIINEL